MCVRKCTQELNDYDLKDNSGREDSHKNVVLHYAFEDVNLLHFPRADLVENLTKHKRVEDKGVQDQIRVWANELKSFPTFVNPSENDMSTEEKTIEDPASSASASATDENKIEASASEAPSTTENDGAEKKKISLKTSDGEVFEIDGDIAMQFQTVKSFFQDEGVGDMVMPVPNVHSAELVMIIDFCTKTQHLHRKVEQDEAWRKELRKISTDFVRELTTDRVMELILAADFLHVDLLLEVLNQTVADRIKNKSVEYVRKLFGVESDYTPEEEQKLREEYAWAFEGVDED